MTLCLVAEMRNSSGYWHILALHFEHIDIWKEIHTLLAHRCHPAKFSAKGHVSQDFVDCGHFSRFQKDGNDAADRAAVNGAAQHAESDDIVHMIQVALMYVQIACEARLVFPSSNDFSPFDGGCQNQNEAHW